MVRSEGNMSLKNPVTPPGIDPGTVRLVAQRLNHCATPDPMGFILGAGKWGIVLKKQVTVRTGGHGVAYCLKMFAVIAGMRG